MSPYSRKSRNGSVHSASQPTKPSGKACPDLMEHILESGSKPLSNVCLNTALLERKPKQEKKKRPKFDLRITKGDKTNKFDLPLDVDSDFLFSSVAYQVGHPLEKAGLGYWSSRDSRLGPLKPFKTQDDCQQALKKLRQFMVHSRPPYKRRKAFLHIMKMCEVEEANTTVQDTQAGKGTEESECLGRASHKPEQSGARSIRTDSAMEKENLSE